VQVQQQAARQQAAAGSGVLQVRLHQQLATRGALLLPLQQQGMGAGTSGVVVVVVAAAAGRAVVQHSLCLPLARP
jgi:hypothetical protein